MFFTILETLLIIFVACVIIKIVNILFEDLFEKEDKEEIKKAVENISDKIETASKLPEIDEELLNKSTEKINNIKQKGLKNG